MSAFDAKIFNPEVFGRYVERVPKTKLNELLKSGVLKPRNELKSMLVDQTGGNYITVPMNGVLDGAPLNYDGSTDITATSTKTFSQSMIVTGRAKAWVERDFSFDITGENFMDNVAEQVAGYWEDIDQDTLLSILKGIYASNKTGLAVFKQKHTTDITGATNTKVDATTLNTAIQKATGDNKRIFKLAIMHSVVATNLENLQLLEYLKYTDANGVTRDLGIATWNGRIVLVDDSMPVEEVPLTYALTSDAALVVGKKYYTKAGDVYTLVASPVVGDIGTYYEVATSELKYTTYLLGDGAFDYVNCGAKVPFEMARDAKTNGGQDTLYTRQRKLFAPKGISYLDATKLSPEKADLETGANWELVTDSTGAVFYDHKAIPIARIVSKG